MIVKTDGLKTYTEREKYVCMYVCRYNVKTRRYLQLEDLVQDVLLIYENCETYNNPGSYFSKEASRQRNLILKFLREEMQYSIPTSATDTAESSERYSLRRHFILAVEIL
jgi:hypothetical protein